MQYAKFDKVNLRLEPKDLDNHSEIIQELIAEAYTHAKN